MLKKIDNFQKKLFHELNENLRSMLFGMGWLFSGQIVIRLLNITYGILLARLIGKNQFGELAIIFSVVTMFSQVAGFGMSITTTRHVALLRKNDPRRAGRCLSFCLILSFSISTLKTSIELMDQARSKRSAFITLFQAATKSCTNFVCESSWA